MKTITISNKSEVTAQGNLHCHRCKPTFRLYPFKIFTSVTDTAADAGCSVNHMVNHLNGKIKMCKGKKYDYLENIDKYWDIIIKNMSTDQMDAEQWRAQQAEQEAARLAEEKRQADIAKAEEKVTHWGALIEKHHAQYLKAIEMHNEAEAELHALRGE